MGDPAVALGAALLTGLVMAVGTAPLLRRLPEPDPDVPDAGTKIRYDLLATPRFVAAVTALAMAAALLGWATVPLGVQPLWAVLASFGVLLTAIDAVTTWLPKRLTYLAWLAMGLALVFTAALGAAPEAVRGALGAVVAGGIYLMIWRLSREGFGFGDVRFAPLLGAAAAAESWTLLATGLTCGTVVGAAHGLLRLVRRRPAEFPYAPSMLIGVYLAAVIGSLWR